MPKTPRMIVRQVHNGMMQRCYNPKDTAYARYGGRGIRVCEEWHDFETFYAYVGDRPSAEYSIDRFPDNNGDYKPGNVRWATKDQQMSNTRSNVWITAFGKSQILEEWGRETGVNPTVIQSRIGKGASPEEAMTRVSHYHVRKKKRDWRRHMQNLERIRELKRNRIKAA